jgi:predicted nucleic-acid-binding Zn-ribbon protein
LYNYVFSQRFIEYWSKKKHNIKAELITNINWDACQSSLNKLPFGKRRWLLKHATRFCGIGKMEKIKGNQEHEDCPRCGQVEDTIHVVRCKGTGTEKIFELAVHNLEVMLCDKFRAPRIKTAITT